MIYRYVNAFVFGTALQSVLLIEKSHPAWQAGRLNGIGGKIEPGEEPIEAMRREWREETGLEHPDFIKFAELTGPAGSDPRNRDLFEVIFYTAICDDIAQAKNPGDERCLVTLTSTVQIRTAIIPNLKWLIPMAETILTDRERADWMHIVESYEYFADVLISGNGDVKVVLEGNNDSGS